MKYIVLAIALSTLAMAEGFESFLERALQQSSYLQSSQLSVRQAEKEGEKLLRYENPSLEVELSQFEPNGSSSLTGYRAALNQPIRLWGVSDDKKDLARSITEGAKADSMVLRSQFIRDISLLYTAYAHDEMLTQLGDEEQHIAKKIFDVSQARYESGTISRATMLQAKVAYEMVLNDNAQRQLKQMRSYFDLLEYAGITEEIPLESDYQFKVKNRYATANSELLKLEAEQKIARSRAQVSESKIEWIDLSAEYESEPDQDIYRLGLSIPLALFNTKSEEKSIALLEAARSKLLFQNRKDRFNLHERYLLRESAKLNALQQASQRILKDEEELLSMFEEAYRVANVNLLELQDIKNRVIDTKKRLISTKTSFNRNAIKLNYIKGNHHE